MWHYTATATGSIESEAQVTFVMGDNGAFQSRVGGPMVRGLSATTEGYVIMANGEGGYFAVVRFVGGTEQDIDYSSPGGSPGYINAAYTFTAGQWYTIRIAAEGAASGNVTLKIWIQSHGASKPSDPGWIGTDESPDYTYVDSEATRLDASGNSLAGISGKNAGEDWDTRHSFYKQRAITDRGVLGGEYAPIPIPQPLPTAAGVYKRFAARNVG